MYPYTVSAKSQLKKKFTVLTNIFSNFVEINRPKT